MLLHYLISSMETETDISLVPVSMQMLDIVADIARSEQLNDIAIIYDDTFGEFRGESFNLIKFSILPTMRLRRFSPKLAYQT